MKRFLIPAFFVIDAETQTEAEELSCRMQEIANDGIQAKTVHFLMQDEELPTKEITIEVEIPHTFHRNCPICSSTNLVQKAVRKDEVLEFKLGQPVSYVTPNDPNTVRLTVCDNCKSVL